MATAKQSINERQIAEDLARQYGIDANDVLFFKPGEAWLGADPLMHIARNNPNVEIVTESFDQFIEPLSQVVHTAMVSLKDGRSFQRTGIARMNEEINGQVLDGHYLAASRAIKNALDAAGINPLKSVQPEAKIQENTVNTDDAASRDKDRRQIHLLAHQAGYITGEDYSGYRKRLAEIGAEFGQPGLNTMAHLTQAQRQIVIEAFKKDLEGMQEL